MRNGARTIFVIAGILFSLYAIVVLSAGISQLSDLAARVHPAFGMFVGWTLSLAFLGLIAAPLVLYYRLPPPLIPPDAEAGAEHDAYLLALKRRLAANPRLRDRRIESDADLQDALSLLSSEADKVVRKAASTVFLGTAVMQNGRLDGLVVLAAQCRLVWQVAAVYYQRPSPRQMVYLYANVGSTALLATAIEDIDFSEIVAPIVVAAIPSLQGAVPGMRGITSLLRSRAGNAGDHLAIGEKPVQRCSECVADAEGGSGCPSILRGDFDPASKRRAPQRHSRGSSACGTDREGKQCLGREGHLEGAFGCSGIFDRLGSRWYQVARIDDSGEVSPPAEGAHRRRRGKAANRGVVA